MATLVAKITPTAKTGLQIHFPIQGSQNNLSINKNNNFSVAY